MPIPKWSLALTISRPFLKGFTRKTSTSTKLNSDGSIPVPSGNFTTDFSEEAIKNSYDVSGPFSSTIGTAYFASKTWLLTAQADIFQNLVYSGIAAPVTINWSFATEYFVFDWLAIRGAIYTNNASTPVPRKGVLMAGSTDVQPPHIDQLGGAAGLSIYRPNSSITFSVTHSYGNGTGQAYPSGNDIQAMYRNVFAFYLSGSYQL